MLSLNPLLLSGLKRVQTVPDFGKISVYFVFAEIMW